MPVFPVDFCRWQWSNTAERQWWVPRIEAFKRAFDVLERESVVAGIRPAAWQFVKDDEMVTMSVWAQQHGLVMLPTNRSHVSKTYTSTAQKGEPNSYRVMFTTPEHAAKVYPALTSNEEIGKLLGYPECCRQAFQETWGQGLVDSTWEQVLGESNVNPWTSNLLRWMGVRWVPHLPCSLSCQPSRDLGLKMCDLASTFGFREELIWANEMLQWSGMGTRLHGIAELTFPNLKVVTRTNWTTSLEKFVVKGGYFRAMTESFWVDNGFSDGIVMHQAHDLLLQGLEGLLEDDSSVVDLGCGNGLLMNRLRLRKGCRVGGLDLKEDILPIHDTHFYACDIKDYHYEGVSAVLINPVRLLEMDEDNRVRVREELKKHRQLLVYAYPDALKNTTLQALSEQSGLGTVEVRVKSPLVEFGRIVP